jgi:hypothetical protein
MSALVMGCFAPDFPNLLFLSPDKSFGHTILGMFLLDLPLALAVLWLFHTFIKRPMLMFLPDGFRRRLRTSVTSFSFWPSNRLSLLVLSILVGTATHLVWDAFTHNTSWLYQNWAFLRRSVDLPGTGEVQMYKLLEYGSSAFGLVVVGVWIWHWYRTAKPSACAVAPPFDGAPRRAFVATLPALAILGGVLRAYHHAHGIHWRIRPLVHFTTYILVSAITLFLSGLIACGFIQKILHRRHVPC